MLNIDRNKLETIISSLGFPEKPESEAFLISISVQIEEPDFREILQNLSHSNEKFLFINQPAKDQTILGFSVLKNFSTEGLNVPAEIDGETGSLKRRLKSNNRASGASPVPLLMGGLKFSPDYGNSIWQDFKSSDWFLPEFILLRRDAGSFAVFNFLCTQLSHINLDRTVSKFSGLVSHNLFSEDSGTGSGGFERISDPDDFKRWTEKMEYVLPKISGKELQKIVLSRRVDLKIAGKPSLPRIIGELEDNYPECYVFAYRSGDSIFLGASPEKLVYISGGKLETDALAGSIPRGKTYEEDRLLGEELLGSRKNLAEQKAVLNFIAEELELYCSGINYSDKPVLKKLSNIQHLWTPVTAELKSGRTVLDVINALHPTPAVCGVPRKPARELIREIEGYNRGLYAGTLGWFNPENEGEFFVGIRSALLKKEILHAFAGCGIVEGSDILSEYRETELKLKPILSIFENENIYQP